MVMIHLIVSGVCNDVPSTIKSLVTVYAVTIHNDNHNNIVILPRKFIRYVDGQNCVYSSVNSENNNNDNDKQHHDNNDRAYTIDNYAAISTIMKTNKINNA